MTPSGTTTELIVFGILATLSVLAATVAFFFSIKASEKPVRKFEIVLGILIFIFLLSTMLYAAWPSTPWARAKELQIANEFMSHLKSSDYASANNLISGDYLDEDQRLNIQADLRNPKNRPLTWNLELAAPHAAAGTVTLTDNTEIPVTIYLFWKWELASWRVNGVRYEPYQSRTDPNNISFVLYPRTLSFFSMAVSTAISILILSALNLVSLYRRRKSFVHLS